MFSWLRDFGARVQVSCSFISIAFRLFLHLNHDLKLKYTPQVFFKLFFCFFPIIFQQKKKKKKKKTKNKKKIISSLLPWPTSHQYNPRIMSFQALLTIQDLSEEDESLLPLVEGRIQHLRVLYEVGLLLFQDPVASYFFKQ